MSITGYEDQYKLAVELLKKPCRIHLIGGGGVGVAGLAALLHRHAHEITACDQQMNACLELLQVSGIRIDCNHAVDHISSNTDLVIVSTAISDNHPEIQKAIELGIPVIRRGVALAAFMRDRCPIAVAGSHGKTTTTSLLVQLLEEAAPHVEYFIGGEWRKAGQVSASPQDPDFSVIEADESDGTLAIYEPDTLVVTNIDNDHLEHHGSEQGYLSCFQRAAARTRRCLIVHASCADKLRQHVLETCKLVTFSLTDESADYTGLVEGNSLSIIHHGDQRVCLTPPLMGRYNAENLLAAAVAALDKGISPVFFESALKNYVPVQRRCEKLAELHEGITVYLDYAHHPTEIKAFITAIKEQAAHRILAVFQPHRYTRTAAFLDEFPDCFANADLLWLCPVYAASEQAEAGADSAALHASCTRKGYQHVALADDCRQAYNQAVAAARPGDIILLIGAGDIGDLRNR